VIMAMPPEERARLPPLTAPVEPRPTPVKLFFTVPSLAAAEEVSTSLGGAVFGPSYGGPGFAARNACDPEGNVFQLREFAPV
jgi:predicted enzyme related to lactoylglutathione lyase